MSLDSLVAFTNAMQTVSTIVEKHAVALDVNALRQFVTLIRTELIGHA